MKQTSSFPSSLQSLSKQNQKQNRKRDEKRLIPHPSSFIPLPAVPFLALTSRALHFRFLGLSFLFRSRRSSLLDSRSIIRARRDYNLWYSIAWICIRRR